MRIPDDLFSGTELIRMALQFIGALVLTWVAVQLALGRYKAEKRWERQVAALSDLLTGIAELRAINATWLTAESRHRERNQDVIDQEGRDYRAAKLRVQSIVGLGAVVLPQALLKPVDDLLTALNVRYDDYIDDLISTDAALSLAQRSLIDAGKKIYGVRRR